MCAHGQPETISRLVACGAMFEDAPGLRSFNHFFDPTRDAPLTVGVPLGYTSPNWSLSGGLFGQDFALKNARADLVEALTSLTVALRSAAFGRLFQSLGQEIHHLQDMAQPQHVRNDAHSDALGNVDLGPFNHPSRYERMTALDLVDAASAALEHATVVPVYPAYRDVFRTPRDFWTQAGKGIADFTNANFVSHGTNFCYIGGLGANPRYAQPVPTRITEESVAALFEGRDVPPAVDALCRKTGQAPQQYLAGCVFKFVASNVTDALTGEVSENPRASTLSALDEDMLRYQQSASACDDISHFFTGAVFSLNAFNFQAAYPYLLPRAVAYSAGYINYVFRGQIEIMPPADGVYALIDHDADAARCIDFCGFSKLKVGLRNTTPGEAMTDGTFVAIVKFHRNRCYRPDLSGEPDTPDFGGAACRSADEEIVVSNVGKSGAGPITGLAVDASAEATFEFSPPIPINASDMSLQVLFQGTLGQEAGAVAVNTKDISEPNYLAVINSTDYVFDDVGDQRYHALPYERFTDVPDDVSVKVRFAKTGAEIWPAEISALKAGYSAQVAFLADLGEVTIDASFFKTVEQKLPVSQFYLSPPATYFRTITFRKLRGVYRAGAVFATFISSLGTPGATGDCVTGDDGGGICDEKSLRSNDRAHTVPWVINF